MSEILRGDFMARPSKCRKICFEPTYDIFIPQGIATSNEQITLTVDEYEVIRLIDLEKLTHAQASKQMDISRTTVSEIYELARYKIAKSLVHGLPLLISGGNYQLCQGKSSCDKNCPKMNHCINQTLNQKGVNIMRIAVTYNNGEIFQHFGHTSQFKVYDIENNQIVNEQIIDTDGQGHGALATFLNNAKADILICGGIGGGAQNALAQAGIKLFGGVAGNADDAVKAYLSGALNYNPNVQCNHHGEGHSCGGHHSEGHGQCHEHKHGCSGNN